MIKHLRFPSIEQFRTVVKSARDANRKYNAPLTTLTFEGTVKLHGTNSSVVSDGTDMWAQSRERVLTLTEDNAGFAQFVHKNSQIFADIIQDVRGYVYGDNPAGSNKTIGIFGEWIGQGIQSKVAISQLTKRFVIFGICILDEISDELDENGQEPERQWLSKGDIVNILHRGALADYNIFDVYQFSTWNIKIDMASPELVQNKLSEITLEVERECPAGKYFGISGLGEGVVWTCIDHPQGRSYRFKVKGKKHSVSKVTELAEVDLVKVANIQEFVERTVTENRLNQMYDKMDELGIDRQEIKNVSQFLKLVGSDVIKEELDVLEASGLTTKDVMSKVSGKARDWYILKLEGNIPNVRP